MKTPRITGPKRKKLPARRPPNEAMVGAFKLDDEAQAYAEEFIEEVTSAEHEAEEGREDAVVEETRERFLREMRELDGLKLEEEEE